MPKPHNILVFDSGAGGLSVANEILRKLDSCILTYFADKTCFPYGALDDEHLIQRVAMLIEYGIAQTKPDIVVIACNTASTIALSTLRERFNLPFVGVVPAVKPAALNSKTGTIGLLATKTTVNREYTLSLIKEFAEGKKVVSLGSNQLVEEAESLIELGHCNNDRVKAELDRLLCLSNTSTIDTIVLACTHFPLIKDKLNEVLPKDLSINWVDSGEAIARRVEFLLASSHNSHKEIQEDSNIGDTHQVEFFITSAEEDVNLLATQYFSFLNSANSRQLKVRNTVRVEL